MTILTKNDKSSFFEPRAPIVSVLGHVDHGKTTLLDKIRQTSIASREAGGITQGIGASTVTLSDGHKITFIDTPGHAAFSKMRSRGANLADIAILVVAVSEGIKPQTKEALEHIKAAKIPFIVVFTKTDLPSISIETVQAQLEQESVYFEGRGGDVPFVAVSAKNGTGITELLDLIILVSEVNGFSGDPNGALEGVIIETTKDKKGLVASVVVRNGSLKIGDNIWAGSITCRIKGLFNELGQAVPAIGPGEPGVILGFDTLPEVGSLVSSNKENTKAVVLNKILIHPEVSKGQIAVFIKAKTEGSLEAIVNSLPEGAVLVASGVGDVTESDISFAKSSKSVIFTFESKIASNIGKLAKTDGVIIEGFRIIYELHDRIIELLKKGQIEILGEAQILAIFPYENKKVAGSRVTKGKITIKDKIQLVRNGQVLGFVKIISMKKNKTEVSEALVGEELGILFIPQLAFEVGDMLVSA